MARPALYTDEELLDAALHVFTRDGYELAHMSVIATAAGTTKPTLYARLGSKEEIFSRVVEREAGRLADYLLARYEEGYGRSTQERVDIGVDALFDYCEAKPESFQVVFGASIGGPAIDRDALGVDRIREGAADLVRDFRSARGLPDGPGVDLVASLMVMMGGDAALHALDRGRIGLDDARHVARGAMRAMMLNIEPALAARG